MKKILICIIIFGLLSLNSCSRNEVSESNYEIDLSGDNYTLYDEVSPLNLSLTFEDVIDAWSDCLNVDIVSYIDNEPESFYVVCQDRSIRYDGNYQNVIDSLNQINDDYGDLRIDFSESDYHISRRLSVQGFSISEYDDDEWARRAYSELVYNMTINRSETVDSSFTEGYCFVFRHYGYTSDIVPDKV